MTITLGPEHERLIARAMQTGAYKNLDEVLARALEMLNSEEWLHDHGEAIVEKIDRAFAQFERGEFFSAEESRAEMEKRKEVWLADRKR